MGLMTIDDSLDSLCMDLARCMTAAMWRRSSSVKCPISGASLPAAEGGCIPPPMGPMGGAVEPGVVAAEALPEAGAVPLLLLLLTNPPTRPPRPPDKPN